MQTVVMTRAVVMNALGVALLGAGLLGCSSKAPSELVGPDGTSSGPLFGQEPEPVSGAMSGYFEGQACAGASAEAQATPSVLLLVVDTSGSMNEPAPGAGGSKWTVTRRAVLDAIDSLPADLSLGVVFYPNLNGQLSTFPRGGTFGGNFGMTNGADSCIDRSTAVPIDALGGAGSPHRQRIQQAFQRQSPDGATPTHDAYVYGLSELQATTAIGARTIVVITDGVPTFSLGCVGTGAMGDTVDPTPLIGEAAAALELGVRTFVIGSPGSEGARESLSRMAEAGDTASPQCSNVGPTYCHLDMTAKIDLGAGLDDALSVVSSQAVSCDYEVPEPGGGAVLDPAKVNVLYEPVAGPQELIRQSLETTCDEGWQYSDDSRQIRLCPSTCERVRSSDGGITLQFGCVTELR